MGFPSCSILTVLMCTISLSKLATVYYDNGGSFDYNQDGLGNYNYTLYLPDQSRFERGTVGNRGYEVYGEYFFRQGGKEYRTSYTADSNGYRTHTRFVSKDDSPPPGYLPPRSDEKHQY